MKIYVVRHGQTDENANNIMQGRTINSQLNRRGIIQAQEVKNVLSDIKFDICFTSPLIRAWSTAMIIAGDKVEIKQDDRLIERYLGELEGKERGTYDVSKYWDYKLNSNDKGVEPIRDILNRCEDFIKYLKENYDKDANILIVSHSAIVKMIENIFENKDYPNKLIAYDIKNCYYKSYDI